MQTQLFQAVPDPVLLGLIGASVLVGYWLLHWYVTRPGYNMFGVVGRRPPVGRASEHGQTSVVEVGTYGAKEGNEIGRALVRANCHGQVGGTVVFELDEDTRDMVWKERPTEFGRVVWGGSPFYKAGLGNQTMEEVGRPEARARWQYDLQQAMSGFCATLRRPGFLVYTPFGLFVRPSFDPSIVLVLVSTGGHLLLAMEAARLLREQFKRADFYAVTILPKEDHQRVELVKALEQHAKDPIFRFWLVTNNALNWHRNDRAVALLLAALMQAHRVSTEAQDGYNLLRTLYPAADAKGVAVLSHWERDLGVYPTPLPPIDFFINRDDAVKAVLDGIYAMDPTAKDPAYKCLDLEAGLTGTRRYVIVNIALRRPYLDDLEREIRARLEAVGWSAKDRNRSLIFASLGEQLSRSSRWITVTVMQLEMASQGIESMKELLDNEQPRLSREGQAGTSISTPMEARTSADETDGVNPMVVA